MNRIYNEILKRLNQVQNDLMYIEDYPEDDYQALQRAIEHFEDKLDGE